MTFQGYFHLYPSLACGIRIIRLLPRRFLCRDDAYVARTRGILMVGGLCPRSAENTGHRCPVCQAQCLH
ncbi:hypothetical protein PsYK624_015320 [Phanerochaete sordida]|uniref:Uncharacterized protein n=1 Tax=Phanerochaete sordida TaxID=48140 RepID=A0A9P3L8X8_9APHY|nr:hypothetical protein PsYK624_015320 [Phanerochaete sordida]